MTLDLKETPPQTDVNSPKISQLDSTSGTEKFFDFVMRNIKELNDNISQRHDLSKPKEGYILYTRELTPSQASSRTSEGFIESITKEKSVKIQEYFVFVPEFSDGLITPTVEQISIFNLLRKNKRNTVGEDIVSTKTLDEGFTDEEKDEFIKRVEKKLLSAFRFYGAGPSIGIGISGCKVLFHDKNNLQFGKMVKITDPVSNDAPKNLKESIKRAKQDLNMKGNAAINQNKQQAMNILEANGDFTSPALERTRKEPFIKALIRADNERILDEAMEAE